VGWERKHLHAVSQRVQTESCTLWYYVVDLAPLAGVAAQAAPACAAHGACLTRLFDSEFSSAAVIK